MSATREDKVYYEGWHDGYKHAIDDMRQELLTLEAWEYYGLAEKQRVPYFSWQNTDYEPFKKAVNRKYNTTCEKAWLV